MNSTVQTSAETQASTNHTEETAYDYKYCNNPHALRMNTLVAGVNVVYTVASGYRTPGTTGIVICL